MIIPSINRATLVEAQKDIRKAEAFLPKDGWFHLDIADGEFTPWKSWNNPEELALLGTTLNIEVHLMVVDPAAVAEAWLRAGAKRLIVPIQRVKDIDVLRSLVSKYDAVLIPSFDSSVPIEDVEEYSWAEFISILSVTPGMSGQKASEEALERIKFLRGVMPDVKIEFDGGVDLEVGALAMGAGANILVSGHYILEDRDSRARFIELNNLHSDVS